MRDYSERRQMRTTVPPRRPSAWPYVLLILALLLLAYCAGVATGWYFLRPGGKYYRAPLTALPVAPPKTDAVLPPQGEPITPATTPPQQPAQAQPSGRPGSANVNTAPPLTFYNTLQKGNKGLIGTGINQPKDGQAPLPSHVVSPPPAVPAPASPQPANQQPPER